MTPIVQVDATDFERPEFQQSLNQFAQVYLAEGDSWLSYGSTKFRNVLGSLALPLPACVLNIARPGDTLRRMHETTRNPQFFFYLRNKSGRRWSAIFLSGGGNDLIDAIWNSKTQRSDILLKPHTPADIDQTNLRSVINEEALADLLSYIKINVSQIVTEGRDQQDGDSIDVPLVMHTYALVQPRNSPVKFFGGGPWLHPACVWLGIAPTLWRELSRLLLEELAACLKSINLPNFHVIDTLHLTAMEPAEPGSKGNSNDWENEIHPNRGGYKKLAATWSAAITQLP